MENFEFYFPYVGRKRKEIWYDTVFGYEIVLKTELSYVRGSEEYPACLTIIILGLGFSFYWDFPESMF